ncbi:MAG: RDD family protein [Gammaproteobacteria bacterium]|nr:RDD family protein [Gammaproteobacteria bacterium]NNC98506.1 RDD family protein [Gammaproteobacteria bacterium]NNM13487.1 RDD family protein [Gammaproteobacteria bacterium]
MNSSYTELRLEKSQPSLFRRLAAIVYDLILLIALLFVFAGLWISITPSDSALRLWGLRVIYIALPMIFYMYFWTSKGQTLGMTTWRLKLRSIDGKTPNLKQQFIRLVVAAISALCLGLGYLWMLVDKNNLTWHDRISGTWLEQLPKPEKK